MLRTVLAAAAALTFILAVPTQAATIKADLGPCTATLKDMKPYKNHIGTILKVETGPDGTMNKPDEWLSIQITFDFGKDPEKIGRSSLKDIPNELSVLNVGDFIFFRTSRVSVSADGGKTWKKATDYTLYMMRRQDCKAVHMWTLKSPPF